MRSQKQRRKPKHRSKKPKKVKRCLDSGYKVMFKSKQAAEAEMKYRRALHSGKVPQRVYHCPSCQQWHLTAMDKDTYEAKTKSA